MRFQEFFPIYAEKHNKIGTQILHAIGMILAYFFGVSAILSGEYWYLLVCPMCAYGFGFTAHFWVQKNTPASFEHPLLSILGDHYMTWLLIKKLFS